MFLVKVCLQQSVVGLRMKSEMYIILFMEKGEWLGGGEGEKKFNDKMIFLEMNKFFLFVNDLDKYMSSKK